MLAAQLPLLPELAPPDDAEYRALLARFEQAWQARYGRVSELKRARAYLDAGDFAHFRRGVQAHRELAAVREMEPGPARTERLQRLYGECFSSGAFAPRVLR